MKVFFLVCAFVTHTLIGNPLYDHVKLLPFDPHGWFANQPQLERVFREREVSTVIELGSWAGLSTLFFGDQLRNKGIVIAVDTWQGSLIEELHKNDPRITYLYQLFLSNMKHAGLEEVVIPCRMKTDEAAIALSITADLIYVDGDHTTEQVYKDIMNWYPHLNSGGLMCGDDWTWDSVRKGVKKAARHLGKKIEHEGAFWCLNP